MIDYYVHESSFVDEGANIGKDTKIWHFCHIYANAIIGNNCVIGQNVMIGPNVVIGNNCKIQNNVSLYDGCIIEDDVFGTFVCIYKYIKTKATIDQKSNFKKTVIKKALL